MLRFGIFLIVMSMVLSGGVVWLDARGIYIFAGSWGSGFGVFSLYFIWAIFVVGLALALIGNILRLMRKEL